MSVFSLYTILSCWPWVWEPYRALEHCYQSPLRPPLWNIDTARSLYQAHLQDTPRWQKISYPAEHVARLIQIRPPWHRVGTVISAIRMRILQAFSLWTWWLIYRFICSYCEFLQIFQFLALDISKMRKSEQTPLNFWTSQSPAPPIAIQCWWFKPIYIL